MSLPGLPVHDLAINPGMPSLPRPAGGAFRPQRIASATEGRLPVARERDDAARPVHLPDVPREDLGDLLQHRVPGICSEPVLVALLERQEEVLPRQHHVVALEVVCVDALDRRLRPLHPGFGAVRVLRDDPELPVQESDADLHGYPHPVRRIVAGGEIRSLPAAHLHPGRCDVALPARISQIDVGRRGPEVADLSIECAPASDPLLIHEVVLLVHDPCGGEHLGLILGPGPLLVEGLEHPREEHPVHGGIYEIVGDMVPRSESGTEMGVIVRRPYKAVAGASVHQKDVEYAPVALDALVRLAADGPPGIVRRKIPGRLPLRGTASAFG